MATTKGKSVVSLNMKQVETGGGVENALDGRSEHTLSPLLSLVYFGTFGRVAVALSQLLQLEDLSALDVAMTNKLCRQSWLDFVAGMGKLSNVDSFKHNACSLKWLNSRKVRLSRLEFCPSPSDINADLLNAIPNVFNKQTSIHINDLENYGVDEKMLMVLGKHCPELTTLVLQNCCGIGGDYETRRVDKPISYRFAGLCALFEGCKKLTSFNGMYSDTEPILQSLATVPTQLESITLLMFCSGVTSDALHRMIKQQPQLKRLNSQGFGNAPSNKIDLQATLSGIVSNCPHFEELRIDGVYGDEVGRSPTLALMVNVLCLLFATRNR